MHLEEHLLASKDLAPGRKEWFAVVVAIVIIVVVVVVVIIIVAVVLMVAIVNLALHALKQLYLWLPFKSKNFFFF